MSTAPSTPLTRILTRDVMRAPITCEPVGVISTLDLARVLAG